MGLSATLGGMTDKNFDVFGFLEGRTFPEDSVELFVDEVSALEANKLLNEKELLTESADDKKRVKAIDSRLQELASSVKGSALTAHLRGTHAGTVSEIIRGEGDKDSSVTNTKLIALFLYKVVDPNGNEDEREFTAEDVGRLRKLLPAQSWGALNDATHEMVVASLAFDRMADSGFFPKS